MSDRLKFDLLALLESIEKVRTYLQDFSNIIADEIWDIIQNKLLPLHKSIETLVAKL